MGYQPQVSAVPFPNQDLCPNSPTPKVSSVPLVTSSTPLTLPEVQFLPWPFVIENPERFSGYARYIFATCPFVLKCVAFLQIENDFDFEKAFSPSTKKVTCAFVLCFRTETDRGLVFPFSSKPLADLPTGPANVRQMCAPYIVPVKPVVPRALCTIFPLLPTDIPQFLDKYRSRTGRWASNKYITQASIRKGIQDEFGLTELRQVFSINFCFFRATLAGRPLGSIPYLAQGRFPIGAVLNGPWLPLPSAENFTSCAATVHRACQHFPHAAGFAMLLPFPKGLWFCTRTRRYQSSTSLPRWVKEIQNFDVALAVFAEPLAYHQPSASANARQHYLCGKLLEQPDFLTVAAFFGFHRDLLTIPMKNGEFDFSTLQQLKPTQHHWIPRTQMAQVVSSKGNAFVVRSKELEEKLLQVNFESKPQNFQELYRSSRTHVPHTELLHFHDKLCDDLKMFYTLPKLRSKFVKWSLGKKTEFLARSALDRPMIPKKRRASTLRVRHRQICLQCHRTGHVEDECIFKCHRPVGLTRNQKLLYNFLKHWKSPLLPLKSLRSEGRTPSLKQLLAFEKKLDKRNKYFWKAFHDKYGLTPNDVNFKQFAYGQIQLKGIPYFANLGLHPALLLQLVAGFNLPLRVDEGETFYSPHDCS